MTGTNSGRRVGPRLRKARKIIAGICEEETDEQVMSVEEWISSQGTEPWVLFSRKISKEAIREWEKIEADKATDSLTKISSVLSLA